MKLTITKYSVFLLVIILCIILIPASAAATSQLHIMRYANDGTTVLNETTVSWQWMQANLPVYGDGSTHYYHQGPVFANDAANATHKEELRWNAAEDTNVQEKDYGAVKGTNLRDLCDLAGGLSPGEEVTIRASDGMTKSFAYRNVYAYSSRQGPMVITWARGTETPDDSYDEAMKLVFFADTSGNPWGIHAFGNSDWKESADAQYWYYYYQGSEKYPTTTGLSVKYISDVIIYSSEAAPAALPPAAAFSADVLSGTAPLTVTFSDESANSPTSWAWDFTNDGTTDSTLQNPSHTFTTEGTYSVTLTATNAHGSTTETKNAYITVTSAAGSPLAQFTVSPESGSAPLTVQFSDCSTGSPVSWAWDFTSDGTTDSTAASPSFVYTTAGTYTVTLTITDSAGVTAQNSTEIQISRIEPAAGFRADIKTGTMPLDVKFTDTSTGTGIDTWSWDFDNDGVVDSTKQNPTNTYSRAGEYSVKLTVSSQYGSSSVVKKKYITVKTAGTTTTLTTTTRPQQTATAVTAAPGSAVTYKAPTKKSTTAITTNPPTESVPAAESPGPDAVAVLGSLAAGGCGTILARRSRQNKR
jgi:PKD repeat protein